MSTSASYDVLYSFKDIHKVVISLAGDLSMERLKGLPAPHASIFSFAKRAGQTGFGSAIEKRK
jgi:hypothetical protein